MRFALIGDSQGVGLKPPLETALRAQGDTLVFSAVETGAGLSRLTEKARSLPPDIDVVLVVCGGGNDDSSVTAPRRWTNLVEALVSAVKTRAPSARLIWAGPMPATEHDAALRKRAAYAQLPSVLAPLAVQWIDGFELARGLSPGRDGVHYAREALSTMAGRLVQALPGSMRSGASSLPWVLAAAAGLATLGGVWLWSRRSSR